MNGEYWKLPDLLSEYRKPLFSELQQLLKDKEEYIQYCYSNDLNQKQLLRVQQDEELLTKFIEYSNLLLSQLNDMEAKYVQVCNEYTKTRHLDHRVQLEHLKNLTLSLKQLAA